MCRGRASFLPQMPIDSDRFLIPPYKVSQQLAEGTGASKIENWHPQIAISYSSKGLAFKKETAPPTK